MPHSLYLSLGSNIEPRESYLCRALTLLNGQFECKKISSLYRTSPVGPVQQDFFYNICALYETIEDDCHAVLTTILSIEAMAGRKREGAVEKGPRTIDIDTLLFDEINVNTPNLIIPHHALFERNFMLIPLKELISGQSLLMRKYSIDEHISKNRTTQFVERKGALHCG